MIQANELRIGNYILDDEGLIAKVEKVESPTFYDWNGQDDEPVIFSVNGSMMMCEVIKPIPLTEEILLKCGFTLNKENTLFEIGGSGLRLMNIGNLYFRANFPIKPDIVHLHQLQNLYFALTGKELEVKL